MDRIQLQQVSKQQLKFLISKRAANLIFLGWIALSFPFVIIFTGNMFQYYKILLGAKAATDLSSSYSVIFAVVGSLGSPAIGALSDRIGMRNMLLIIDISLVVFAVLIFIPSIIVQYFSLVILSLTYSCVILASPQWALAYVSPSKFQIVSDLFSFLLALFGSYLGIQLLVAGIVQIILTFAIPPIMQALSIDGMLMYVILYSALLSGALLFGVAIVIYLSINPKPKQHALLSINE